MKIRHWMGIVAVMTAVSAHTPVRAQVYRCGNAYQDHPCEGAQTGKQSRPSSSAQPSSTIAIDDDCAQRGLAAQKIMWAREAGRTEELQLAAATSANQRKLVGSVYRKRGSATEVRAAIESECAAEKQ